jgi:hypothetical protein
MHAGCACVAHARRLCLRAQAQRACMCACLPRLQVPVHVHRHLPCLLAAHVLRRTRLATQVLRKWVSRFDLWPYVEQFTLDVQREIMAGAPQGVLRTRARVCVLCGPRWQHPRLAAAHVAALATLAAPRPLAPLTHRPACTRPHARAHTHAHTHTHTHTRTHTHTHRDGPEAGPDHWQLLRRQPRRLAARAPHVCDAVQHRTRAREDQVPGRRHQLVRARTRVCVREHVPCCCIVLRSSQTWQLPCLRAPPNTCVLLRASLPACTHACNVHTHTHAHRRSQMDPTYHFSCQFTADLIAMNHADFIITSTYQVRGAACARCGGAARRGVAPWRSRRRVLVLAVPPCTCTCTCTCTRVTTM